MQPKFTPQKEMAKITDKKTSKMNTSKAAVGTNPEVDERVEQFAQTVDANNLQARILEVTENKGARNAVFGVLGVLVLAVAGVFGWQWYVQQQEAKAQQELYPVQYYFEQDSMSTVLSGDGVQTIGADKIANDYSMTNAGDLAAFYAGVANLKQGKFNEAIENLKNFNADDYLVQARAYSLIGDAYMELNNLNEAVSYYKQAANHYPNDVFTPDYLMKLALAYELQKDYVKAAQTYQVIIEKHRKSDLALKAKRAMAKVEAMQKTAA